MMPLSDPKVTAYGAGLLSEVIEDAGYVFRKIRKTKPASSLTSVHSLSIYISFRNLLDYVFVP